ncbi:MAG: hypothetical protein A2275_07890 [Bacteroidetes bacterium RIFOXYA12_FULL_35_11]|nr:MAG: hypothetical protein A2X01_06665 [Bacteroidetes bacterium GWF2_35_48]OFY78908.1 MAG: hypothetical protein A2275_07890 [Bacteroidetes bacterium RIFOXYA12_FULL_35_11]OFY93617.1 MAG: hypothetical protein A2491_01095 [Bacteroidetes bacterium RIFOXYC12_FULL_35_7]OFY96991.1 MAG: hypothetical protein A2309_09860 [Bacteroidetes bacterium RIFOXYB2_FULL_35_7]HBX49665.1 hypothetical protein [Bacteroidales bacterium]
MLKFVFLSLIFCCAFNVAYCQIPNDDMPSDDPLIIKKSVFRLSILSPGVSYERQVVGDNTFVVGVYASLVIDTLENQYSFHFYPNFFGEFRHYYNFARRIKEGKSINRFSGNYIGGRYEHFFGDSNFAIYDKAGLIWGIQRNWPSHFYINFNIGLGVQFSHDPREMPMSFAFLGDLHLGFAF